jgi:hypothetical protein
MAPGPVTSDVSNCPFLILFANSIPLGEGQLFLFFRSMFIPGLSLATEIIVLRQQFPVINSTVKRPQLRWRDRLFWVCLSRLW